MKTHYYSVDVRVLIQSALMIHVILYHCALWNVIDTMFDVIRDYATSLLPNVTFMHFSI